MMEQQSDKIKNLEKENELLREEFSNWRRRSLIISTEEDEHIAVLENVIIKLRETVKKLQQELLESQSERQREHDLRVRFAGVIEGLENRGR